MIFFLFLYVILKKLMNVPGKEEIQTIIKHVKNALIFSIFLYDIRMTSSMNDVQAFL